MCNGGGGIYIEYCNSIISHNIFRNNTTLTGVCGGGAIFCGEGEPLISNNIIINNSILSGKGGGGGIFCNGDAKIFNNIISNNLVDGYSGGGGGIYCYFQDDPVISNNIITNNSVTNSNEGGGAIYCELSCSPQFNNNTIANNSTQGNGGALYCFQEAHPIFYDCILYGNTAAISGGEVFLNDEQSDPDFFYCDVEGGSNAFGLNGNFYTGIYQNNIDSDPMFTFPSGGSGTGYNGSTADWSLKENSSCIDTGIPDTTGLKIPFVDFAGNPRIFNDRIDIGAYEYFIPANKVENMAHSLHIYPNPVNEYMTIEGLRVGKIDIMNLNGQIIKSIYVTNSKTEINVSTFANGVYIMKVILDDCIFMKKFLKQ